MLGLPYLGAGCYMSWDFLVILAGNIVPPLREIVPVICTSRVGIAR